MLTRKHRFHGRTSLVHVYRRGATKRVQHIALRYVRSPDRSDYRVAVIVSRKVHKSAVARNRLRRRIYEIIRTGPTITEPYDLVFTIFSDQVSAQSPDELTGNVRSLLAQAHVYRKSEGQLSTGRAIVKPEER